MFFIKECRPSPQGWESSGSSRRLETFPYSQFSERMEKLQARVADSSRDAGIGNFSKMTGKVPAP
jgi:hypothetical protein